MNRAELKAYFKSVGKKGGQARAKNMTAAERKASAQKAAQTRWKDHEKKST